VKRRICALIAVLTCGTIAFARGGRGSASPARGHSAAAGPAEMQIEGAVGKEEGKYFLVDEGTGQRFELRGSALERHVGERVVVRGTVTSESSSGGAPLIMLVSNARSAAAGSAGKATAAAISGGLSTPAIVGIAAGAAGGATVGGLYAAGVIGGSDQAASPE
jgi:hypothetical protein